MSQKYAGQVDFLVVYIREAHPEDGWVVTMNRNEEIKLDDPTTTDERTDVAESCALRLEIKMPVVVDEIDDAVASAYGALPDRLYLIGRGGRVAFQVPRGSGTVRLSASGSRVGDRIRTKTHRLSLTAASVPNTLTQRARARALQSSS
jgi:hypothetical protein